MSDIIEAETEGGAIVAVQDKTLRRLLEKAKPSIVQALPRHLNADRLIKVALVAVSKDRKLQRCSPRSVLQSVMAAAQLGLDCGGLLGSGYLVPYGDTCQFIAGYRGLIDLARRSGQVGAIFAYAVHEGDVFEHVLGTDPTITHRPMAKHGAKLTHVYAVAKLVGGDTQFVVMTKDEVDDIRLRSKAGNNGPWKTDYEEMAKKTAIRRLCKYLPVSADLAAALALEDRAESGGVMPLEMAGLNDVDLDESYDAPVNAASAINERIRASAALPTTDTLTPPTEVSPPPAGQQQGASESSSDALSLARLEVKRWAVANKRKPTAQQVDAALRTYAEQERGGDLDAILADPALADAFVKSLADVPWDNCL